MFSLFRLGRRHDLEHEMAEISHHRPQIIRPLDHKDYKWIINIGILICDINVMKWFILKVYRHTCMG